MARTVALVAMGKSARHRASFNMNPDSHGMVGDHNTINCNDIIEPLKWNRDYHMAERDAHGNNPDTIATTIARDEFVNLCDEIVQRFLLQQDPLPVIVLMDDWGKQASWVAANFMKDVLNSMNDADGNRRFNVVSFVIYEVCDVRHDNSLVNEQFDLARRWLREPWTVEEPPPHRDQYGVAHLANFENGVYDRAQA